MRHVFAPDQARWGGRVRRPGRRAAGVMAAAAGLILVTGCQFPGFSSSAAAGPTASGTVTVEAPRGVPDAPLYIGLRDGLFSKVGLTVHVVSASSVPQEVAALRNHTADIAFGDYANMFYAEEQNHPAPHLLAVADGYDAGPNMVEVLTLPGSKIVTPKDLEYKVIGTASAQAIPTHNAKQQPQPYGIDTVATWSVLASDNVHVGRITWDPMPASDLIGALKDGQVNAILATEPTIYAAESELGAVPVVDACTGATANLPLDGYFTTNSYATKNPQVVAAFRSALAKAQAQAAMAAPLQTALTKSARLKAQAAAMVTLGTYPTTTSALNLQRVVNLMYIFGSLPKNFEVKSIVVKPNGS
ncbi:MAG TPA: ABC transporter substrate-binding protein [Streptosporangiaceae bacterium]|nr:ABC transporter substrate-binding protein [Streptosporangiaceae bacterium]